MCGSIVQRTAHAEPVFHTERQAAGVEHGRVLFAASSRMVMGSLACAGLLERR